MAVCILIPVYNARHTLRSVAEESLCFGLPLVIVDDGSTDGSSATLDGLPLTLLFHQFNRGKGAALRTGFRWALDNGFEGIITLDADGQHDPSAIPLMVEMAAKGDFGCLLASRSSQFDQMSGLRKIWNRFGVWCMKKATGFEITDSQSGFRYYACLLLKTVELEKNGYDLEMELLMKAWKAGFRLGSIPVPARVADGRLTSHYRPVRDTWHICMTFLKFLR